MPRCVTFAAHAVNSAKLISSKDEENAGLIPRAIDMIFKVSGQLKDRGWKYQMEGQFLEVYNEVVCDLLDLNVRFS